MTYTYDLTTDIGIVRLNTLQDADIDDPILSDEAISALLLQEGSSIKRTSARALEIIAGNQLYIQKVIRVLALSTQGNAVSAEFRALAATLREQAEYDDLASSSGFDIAEQAFNSFGVVDILRNSALRGQD